MSMAEAVKSWRRNVVGQVSPVTYPPSLPAWQPPRPITVEQCVARYKDGGNFLRVFNPSEQFRFTRDLKRCYMGDAPTLVTIGKSFGDAVAETWVEIQVNNLSEFAGCKGKLSDAQTEEIARVVVSAYGYLKATELMHFFVLFKSGEFGSFFGVVDGMVITSALRKYLRVRSERLQVYEREERERLASELREKERGRAMSYAEWVRSRAGAAGWPDKSDGSDKSDVSGGL